MHWRSTAGVMLCTVVGAAHGQMTPSGLTLLVGDATLLPGQSTTIRLEASFDASRDYCVGAVVTWVDSSAGAQGLGDLRLVGALAGPGTSAGAITERGVRGILAGQLNGLGEIYGDPSNPIAFWEATYTAPIDVAEPFEVVFETRTSRFDVYPRRDSARTESRLDGFQDDMVSIRVVPAPASAAVLLGVLACTGRRRREPGREKLGLKKLGQVEIGHA